MNLKQKIVSAVGWSVGVKVTFQIITWAMTIVVIRILTPDDYGAMAVSQVFLNFMLGFGSLGLGDALVQQESTPQPIVARVFGTVLLTSTVLTVGLSVAAYPIAHWYRDERLVALIQVSSLGFLFSALTMLPRTFLTKALKVRAMFIMELTSGLLGAMTVMALAYTGYGVWSLMLGWLVSSTVRLLGFIVIAREYYVWPRFGIAGIGPLLSFGIYRTFEYTVWIIFTSADILIVGRWLGPTAVGIYSVAMNFAMMPLSKIAPIINSTAFPAFAMVQTQPREARFYALKSLRMMATVSVPIFFGIAATAPEVVDVIFGPNWAEAKLVLSILAVATTFRAILLVIPNYLQGIGDSRAGFWCTAVGALIFPPAFVLGCQWGIEGVAYAWLAGYPIVYVVNAVIASRCGGLDVKALIFAPIRPMAVGAIMFAAVASARVLLPDALPEVARFALLVAIGAVTYGAFLMLLFRNLVVELAQIFRRAPSAAG